MWLCDARYRLFLGHGGGPYRRYRPHTGICLPFTRCPQYQGTYPGVYEGEVLRGK